MYIDNASFRLFLQVAYLAVKGGTTLKQSVPRIVDAVLTHPGQLNANLEGRVKGQKSPDQVFGIRGPILELICSELLSLS